MVCVLIGGREESPERPIVWRATETVQVTTSAEIAELRWRVAGWPLPSIHVWVGFGKRFYALHSILSVCLLCSVRA